MPVGTSSRSALPARALFRAPAGPGSCGRRELPAEAASQEVKQQDEITGLDGGGLSHHVPCRSATDDLVQAHR